MMDNQKIAEENARYPKKNATMVKALSWPSRPWGIQQLRVQEEGKGGSAQSPHLSTQGEGVP